MSKTFWKLFCDRTRIIPSPSPKNSFVDICIPAKSSSFNWKTSTGRLVTLHLFPSSSISTTCCLFTPCVSYFTSFGIDTRHRGLTGFRISSESYRQSGINEMLEVGLKSKYTNACSFYTLPTFHNHCDVNYCRQPLGKELSRHQWGYLDIRRLFMRSCWSLPSHVTCLINFPALRGIIEWNSRKEESLSLAGLRVQRMPLSSARSLWQGLLPHRRRLIRYRFGRFLWAMMHSAWFETSCGR